MKLFFCILVFVLALCGAAYLLRDGYRVWIGRHRPCPKCDLVYRADRFPDRLSVERAFLHLDAYLSRPEAKYLVQNVVITGVEVRRVKEFHDAAQSYDFSLVCQTDLRTDPESQSSSG